MQCKYPTARYWQPGGMEVTFCNEPGEGAGVRRSFFTAIAEVCTRIQVEILHVHTVWPEILAGRYFGGLLKICHLAEFTLAVEPVLAITIFITKWLIERAGNLTGP